MPWPFLPMPAGHKTPSEGVRSRTFNDVRAWPDFDTLLAQSEQALNGAQNLPRPVIPGLRQGSADEFEQAADEEDEIRGKFTTLVETVNDLQKSQNKLGRIRGGGQRLSRCDGVAYLKPSR